VDFLILDDIGKEYKGVRNQLNPMVNLKFDTMMRERLNKNLVTIGSTNYDIKSLKEVYGESVLSVIYGACKILEIKGKDFRVIKGKGFWDELEKE
jgi:DNA replication protein DnaC